VKNKEKYVKLGVVGVDSGQLMICDPCYVDSEWAKKEVEFKDQLEDQVTKEVVDSPRKTGGSYDDVYKDKLTWNQAIKKGILKELPEEETGEFSYDGCCKATMNEDNGGQLNYKLGHEGAGVVFSSGYGDGEYPVYVKYGKEGRITEVRIILIGEAE